MYFIQNNLKPHHKRKHALYTRILRRKPREPQRNLLGKTLNEIYYELL